jgi:hypothetical protein
MVDLKAYASAHGANVTGWSFTEAWGVSADGTAVSGWGFLNGHQRAFVIKGLPCISGYFVQNPIPTSIALSTGTIGGAGTTAQFTVQAEGAGPLEYSWTMEVGAGMQPVTLNGPRYDDPVTGLSFAVADVAGKGTSAAILNAVVQGLFAAEAETADNPAEVLRHAIVAAHRIAKLPSAAAARLVVLLREVCDLVPAPGITASVEAALPPHLRRGADGDEARPAQR